MKLKRIIASVLLAATLMIVPACKTKPVNVDPNHPPPSKADEILSGAKTFGGILADALDEGINLEAQFAANGTIDPKLEPQIRQWLQDGKKSTADFNARLAKYDHADADTNTLIANFLDEAVSFVSNLEANGILRIKNQNSQLAATGILLGAKAAIRVYKAKFVKARVQ